MKKLNYSIAMSIICVLQGCSIYHAPWQSPYEQAPIYKETKVYHAPAPVVNDSRVTPVSTKKFVPVLNENTNQNKRVQVKKAPSEKTETAFKEKVITVKKSKANEIPQVSEVANFQRNESMPDDDHILIIPIE